MAGVVPPHRHPLYGNLDMTVNFEKSNLESLQAALDSGNYNDNGGPVSQIAAMDLSPAPNAHNPMHVRTRKQFIINLFQGHPDEWMNTSDNRVLMMALSQITVGEVPDEIPGLAGHVWAAGDEHHHKLMKYYWKERLFTQVFPLPIGFDVAAVRGDRNLQSVLFVAILVSLWDHQKQYGTPYSLGHPLTSLISRNYIQQNAQGVQRALDRFTLGLLAATHAFGFGQPIPGGKFAFNNLRTSHNRKHLLVMGFLTYIHANFNFDQAHDNPTNRGRYHINVPEFMADFKMKDAKNLMLNKLKSNGVFSVQWFVHNADNRNGGLICSYVYYRSYKIWSVLSPIYSDKLKSLPEPTMDAADQPAPGTIDPRISKLTANQQKWVELTSTKINEIIYPEGIRYNGVANGRIHDFDDM